jgi:hypothetical protein
MNSHLPCLRRAPFVIVWALCDVSMPRLADGQQSLYVFIQYALAAGQPQVQAKSDVEISLKMIGLTDLYSYPDLFSVNLDAYTRSHGVGGWTAFFPKGPQGMSWSSPLSTYNGGEQMVVAKVRVRNSTSHILRMSDARIYLVVEGHDPVPALPSPDSLIRRTFYFEQATNYWYEHLPHGLISINRQIPQGFYAWIVDSHRDSYRLINDLSKEILPGSSLTGLLVFPAIILGPQSARITFFDVATKTDAAGNTTEKSQFDFALAPRLVGMWWDRDNMWHTASASVQVADEFSEQQDSIRYDGYWLGNWSDPEGSGSLGFILRSEGDSVFGVECARSGKTTAVATLRGVRQGAVIVAELSAANTVFSHARIELSPNGQSLSGSYSQEIGRKTWDASRGRLQASRGSFQSVPGAACGY